MHISEREPHAKGIDMEALKIFCNFLLAGMVCGCIYLIGAFLLSYSTFGFAGEPIKDCTFVPTQASPVTITCGTLHGQGSVGIRICGINYTVDVVCA
jgi:hypothetical protein